MAAVRLSPLERQVNELDGRVALLERAPVSLPPTGAFMSLSPITAAIAALQAKDVAQDAKDATQDANIQTLLTDDINAYQELALRAKRIADVAPAGDMSTIALSSIPQTFAHLLLVFTGRCNAAGGSVPLRAWFNADPSGVYYSQEILAAGAGAVVTAVEEAVPAATSARIGAVTGAGATASMWGTALVLFSNYVTAATFKHFVGLSFAPVAAAGNSLQLRVHGGVYAVAAALSSLTLWATGPAIFVSSARATLYGLP